LLDHAAVRVDGDQPQGALPEAGRRFVGTQDFQTFELAAPNFGVVVHGFMALGASNRTRTRNATLQAACTITGIAVSIGTSSGNICFALYDASYNRLATSGSVASPGTGYHNVAFTGSYAAAAGRYILAVSADNNTVTFSKTSAANNVMLSQYQETAFVLPNPLVPAGPAADLLNIIGLISGGFPT
jgi:hypothetical protein